MNGYISSEESGDGNSPSTLPAGPQAELFGQEVAHANPSVWLAVERGWLTLDTYGRRCTGSSESANLQRCLESKLRQMTDLNGSPEYALTWKKRAMLSGVPICLLRASVRRTQGKDYGGWPTPDTVVGGLGRAKQSRNSPRLIDAAQGWATPQARDYKGHTITDRFPKGFTTTLANQAVGKPRRSSGVPMVNEDALNPELSRWLMGFPEGWSSYADMETPSSHK
jgi:hypothetical protein